MSKAIAIVRAAAAVHSTNWARLAIVLVCAGALILAGNATPF